MVCLMSVALIISVHVEQVGSKQAVGLFKQLPSHKATEASLQTASCQGASRTKKKNCLFTLKVPKLFLSNPTLQVSVASNPFHNGFPSGLMGY